MATEFDPDQVKTQLTKLDDFEIERRIEQKALTGQSLEVARQILKARQRTRHNGERGKQLLFELAAILAGLILSLGFALYARDRIF